MSARGRFATLLAAAVAGLAAAAPAHAAGPAVWVNEIHYDNAGVDVDEGVELAGPAGTDLTGWSIALYNGHDGLPYAVAPVSGTLPDQASGVGTAWLPISGLENGSPDGLAVLDADGAVVQAFSYEGALHANGGPLAGLIVPSIVPFEHPSTAAGLSLQLIGSGRRAADFTWASTATAASPGRLNRRQHIRSVAAPAGTPTPSAAPSPSPSPRPSTTSNDPADTPRKGADPDRGSSLPQVDDDPGSGTPSAAVVPPGLTRLRVGLRIHPWWPRPQSIRYLVGTAGVVHIAIVDLRRDRTIATFDQDAVVGRNVFAFGGRAGGRILPVGRYRLTATFAGVAHSALFIVPRH